MKLSLRKPLFVAIVTAPLLAVLACSSFDGHPPFGDFSDPGHAVDARRDARDAADATDSSEGGDAQDAELDASDAHDEEDADGE